MNKNFFEEILPEIAPRIEGLAPPFLLKRSDRGDDRYYFKVGGSEAYLSMTSFCKKALPTSPELVRYVNDRGIDLSEFIRDEAADYGTFMHIVCVEVLKSGSGHLGEIQDMAREEAISRRYYGREEIWSSKIINDLLSFITFLKEKNVVPVAAEFPVASDEFGIAGMVDLPCELDFNGSRVKAIVDMKSGRKGFWPEHELQIHGYMTMWNDWFGSIYPVTHVFNWAPNNWRDSPTYKLKNQTKSAFASTIRQRMAIAKEEGWIKPPKSYTYYDGAFTLEDFDIDNHKFEISPT